MGVTAAEAEGAGPVHGWRRLVRAAALSATVLLLAVLAHAAGGGGWPAAAVLVPCGVLVWVVALILTARRCGPLLLVTVLGVQEALLHLAFEAAAGSSVCTVAPAAHDAAGVGGSCHEMTHSGSIGPSWSMLAAHALATVMTAWLLARGEAWLWGVVRRLAGPRLSHPRVPAAVRYAVAFDAIRPFRQWSVQPCGPRAPPVSRLVLR